MKYTYIKNDDSETIVALIDGDLYSITNEHPCWDDVRWKCSEGTATPEDFDIEKKVIKYLELSDRAGIDNGVLNFDGEEMHTVLADKIIANVTDGVDATGLVNFMELLADNPSRNSRDQLFTWLEQSGFEITDAGLIVGYKSVYSTDEGYLSVSSGTATVNGITHTGQIPQKIGDVVTMPRSEVTDNPAESCSYGLHVGTLSYAKGFSGDTILIIHVDPADVVSVPQDSNFEKMRVCRYWVADVYKTEPKVLTHSFDSSLIKSASWQEIDETYGILTVELNNGVYNYEEVPLWNYETLVHSDSPGCWYITYIRYNYNLI